MRKLFRTAQGQGGQSDTSKSKELSWLNVLRKRTGSSRITHCCVYKIHSEPWLQSDLLVGSLGFIRAVILPVACVRGSWSSGLTSAVTAGPQPELFCEGHGTTGYSWLALGLSVSWECPYCPQTLFGAIYIYITWRDTELTRRSCDSWGVIWLYKREKNTCDLWW